MVSASSGSDSFSGQPGMSNWEQKKEAVPFLADTVSETVLPRVCCIFDALIKAIEPLGCSLTDDLKFIVNGETVSLSVSESQDNVLLVCNEEAKLLGLPENRFLRNRNGVPYDIIHGTFFLAQGSGEEFCSLTDKQIQTYTRLYSREKLFVMQHGKVINQPKKGKSTHER